MYGHEGVEGAQTLLDGSEVLLQRFGGGGLRLGEDGGEVVASGVVDRCQRLLIEQLGTLHNPFAIGVHQLLHGHYGLAGFFDVLEVEHGAGLAGLVNLGAHHHFGQEGQGAL